MITIELATTFTPQGDGNNSITRSNLRVRFGLATTFTPQGDGNSGRIQAGEAFGTILLATTFTPQGDGNNNVVKAQNKVDAH